MTLDIIGAGFGRTGTDSLKRALNRLGFGPCYHMYEVLPRSDRITLWRDINLGTVTPVWDQIFNGYRAAVDWPAVLHWRALIKQYPMAKVILTYRDPESWFASMEKSILKILDAATPEEESKQTLSVHTQFRGDFSRKAMIETYNTHVSEVKRAVPSDRLLVLDLGVGWAPLCDFLNCPIPDEPYPKGNDALSFHETNRTLGGPDG